MKQLINGREVKMTARQAEEFDASRASLQQEPEHEILMPASSIAAGLKALGFTEEQVTAFVTAASAG